MKETVESILSEIYRICSREGTAEAQFLECDLVEVADRIKIAHQRELYELANGEDDEMTNETIEDIVAEMRNHASGSVESAWYTPESWRQLCDRIEAADKRLRAALKPVMECDCKVLASRQFGDSRFTMCDDDFVKLCKVTEAVRAAQEIMKGENQ